MRLHRNPIVMTIRRQSEQANRSRSMISTRRATVLCCLLFSINSVAQGQPHPLSQETPAVTEGTNSPWHSGRIEEHDSLPDVSTRPVRRPDPQQRKSDGSGVSPSSRTPVGSVRKLTMPPLPNSTARVDSQVRRASHTQISSVPIPPVDAVAVDPNAELQPQVTPLELPTPDGGEIYLPLESSEPTSDIQLELNGELLSLSFHESPLREVLSVLAASQDLNIICSSGAEIKVTGSFNAITFDNAINTVLSVSGHTWVRRNNVIIVTPLDGKTKLAPDAQGREVRVFTLNYLSSMDIQKACTGLMSPSGTMVITESDPTDSHKTREQVLVEDLPMYVERISTVIQQLDVQPRQVLIEAHILQVELKDERTHGVDFAKLASIDGTKFLVGGPNFNGKITDLNAFSTPSYQIGIFNAGSFSGLIEALQKTSDAKTLASPKVLALNGQEAHVQIGKRLGYHVTTTTQTSSLQSVQFLDTGVVLRVTPRITDDGQIMMTVKPEVSDGAVDAQGLPSSTTTEVETNIMLPDGKGMVIGGLIREADSVQQQKVPVLGNLWIIGKAFRRNATTRSRTEIIIVLVPHIIGGPEFDVCREETEVQQASTPLLHGPLERIPRPWEAKLPDAVEKPQHLDKDRVKGKLRHPFTSPSQPLEYYFPTRDDASSNTMTLNPSPDFQSGGSRNEFPIEWDEPAENFDALRLPMSGPIPMSGPVPATGPVSTTGPLPTTGPVSAGR